MATVTRIIYIIQIASNIYFLVYLFYLHNLQVDIQILSKTRTNSNEKLEKKLWSMSILIRYRHFTHILPHKFLNRGLYKAILQFTFSINYINSLFFRVDELFKTYLIFEHFYVILWLDPCKCSSGFSSSGDDMVLQSPYEA